MSKGTMKNKIRFELESREEVHQCEYSIRGLNGIVTEAEHRTLALTFYDAQNCPDQDSRIRTVYNILKNTKVSWQVVGPRCPAISEMVHDVSNANMISQSALSRHSPYWRCTQAGCGKTVDVEIAGLITFREFQSAVARASVGEKNISWVVADVAKKGKFAETYSMGVKKFVELLMRDLKENFPEATDMTIRKAAKSLSFSDPALRYQGSAMDLYGAGKLSAETMAKLSDIPPGALQVHDEFIVETEKAVSAAEVKVSSFVGNLQEEIIHLQKVNQSITKEINELSKLNGLPLVADEMFRFLAGLNMQDRSVSEQREFLRLMRNMKEALQASGIGSKD